MDKKVSARGLCMGFWLILYSSPTGAQDRCVTIKQDGISLLHGATKLVCRLKRPFNCDFHIAWDIDAKHKATVDRRGNSVIVSNQYKDKYNCQWIEDEMSSVLTIKNTTVNDEGQWYCNFMADDGCIGSVGVDIKVIGMMSEFRY